MSKKSTSNASAGFLGAFTSPALMIGGALLGGLGALGESPKEQMSQELLDKFKSLEDFFKDTPFSKEEVMNVLLPEYQRLVRGASDVAAGRLGANIGEAGLTRGQPTADYYMQSLAPVIAKGENLAASAIPEFGKWFSNMDSQSKQLFAHLLGLEVQASQGLPDMTGFQRFISGALGGIGIGTNAVGALAESGNNNLLQEILDKL